MVRAGEKIKYCSVGHLVGHIYFASSIETLNKEGQKCGRKLSERLEACQWILTIKEKIVKISYLWPISFTFMLVSIMICYTSGSHVHKFVFTSHRCLDVQLQTLFWMATLLHCVNSSPWSLNTVDTIRFWVNETKQKCSLRNGGK